VIRSSHRASRRGIVTTPVCDGESVFLPHASAAEDSEHGRKAVGSDHAKSKSVVRKKTKRPMAVQLHVKSLRLPADLAQRIDHWAKAMGEDSHSEAMRHLLEIGLSAEDRSAPMPIAPVPQGDLRSVAKPKSGIDPFADEQPGGLACPDRREDEKLWLRVPTPSAHRSELWKGAMRPHRVLHGRLPQGRGAAGEHQSPRGRDPRRFRPCDPRALFRRSTTAIFSSASSPTAHSAWRQVRPC
jgi:hypothetical protein